MTLYKRMAAVAPDHPHAWWDRARLEVSTGDIHQTRASLSAMLEVARDERVRNHVYAALDAISGSTS